MSHGPYRPEPKPEPERKPECKKSPDGDHCFCVNMGEYTEETSPAHKDSDPRWDKEASYATYKKFRCCHCGDTKDTLVSRDPGEWTF